MNNSWNKIIYKVGAPLYDRVFNSGMFLTARKHVFQNIHLEKRDKILFVGVGTGADLELISNLDLNITAIDYSKAMLDKARMKFINEPITFIEMDAQSLKFENGSFDYIFASLILSVVPNPDLCLQEMTRVLKTDGKIIIFDKFASPNKKTSLLKKIIISIIKVFGTDISLVFEKIFQPFAKKLKIEEDTPIMLNGMYRKIVIRKR
ncbi:class I SAM-dependent methyltransferase [Bacillus massiliigorillae]|uniref:class I SAM-dependent methyltransferase n=1 Tax=Bacillus massiliigorillae TaxID=1243664 RepID=UPI0003A50318|nr:class I SAM-dependent methyltransferase [Bacillus massiliigorillae]